jgi:hypothetical protein
MTTIPLARAAGTPDATPRRRRAGWTWEPSQGRRAVLMPSRGQTF